jgi:hypothetical protein
VAEPKPASRHTLKLEYSFDRLLAIKLAQVYQVLVPDKRWRTEREFEGRVRAPLEEIDEQDSGHLRASLF